MGGRRGRGRARPGERRDDEALRLPHKMAEGDNRSTNLLVGEGRATEGEEEARGGEKAQGPGITRAKEAAARSREAFAGKQRV